MESINPTTGERLTAAPRWTDVDLERALADADVATVVWQQTTLVERARLLKRAAEALRRDTDRYARVITLEMGKLLKEARAEIEKCAACCEHYAEHGERYLRDDVIPTEAGKSYVAYQPLGTVLAIMPWNF